MQTRLGFESHPGYLKAVFAGDYPLSPADLLMAVRDEAQRTGETRILADCLALAMPQKEIHRFQVGEVIADIFKYQYKIAMLYPAHAINRFTENTANNRGAHLQVFGDEASALKWLLE